MAHATKRRPRRGFTLVEILVVIAVIAVLVAIILPSLAGARDSSRLASCLANTRSIGQALAMYSEQYKGAGPHWSGWQLWEGDGTGGDAPGPGWNELLMSTVDSKEVFRDPARPVGDAPFGYFMQARFVYSFTHAAYTSLRQNQVQFPAQFVWAGDCDNPMLYAAPYGSTANQPDCDQDDASQPAVFFAGELFAHKPGGKDQSTGRANILFFDGHAATHARFEKELMTWHGSKFQDWATTQ